MKTVTKLMLFVLASIITLENSTGQSIPDLIKNAGTKAEYPNAKILTIFDSTRVNVRPDGLSYFYTHRLYKILTPEGAATMNVVKYDYDPLSSIGEIQKVYVYRINGTKEELDITKIMDYPAPARMIFWGAREQMIELGRLEPNDAVEVFCFKKGFTYALLQDNSDDEKYIPPMRGSFYDIVNFWSAEPVINKTYQVNVPNNKPLQYQFYNGEVQSSTLFVNDRIVYTFTKKNFTQPLNEHRMVALSDVAPKLVITSTAQWKEKSIWFFNVNEDYGSFESTPEILAKVKEILKSAKNEMDTITLLTQWCANEIRYCGLPIPKGEGYTLHKGEMTFTDRSGVCKDKAGMLITMLRAAGKKSYAAMTMAGSRIENIPADQFNHCVSVVQLNNGNFMLLDPTWVPFTRELWSSLEQQQNYLIGLPNGDDLKITPISPPENHYFKINGASVLLPNGTLEGNFTVTAEGQSDRAIRSPYTGNQQTAWRAMLEKELMKLSPTMEIIELKYPNFYDCTKPIQISVKYRIPNYAIITDKEIIFTPIVAAYPFKSTNTQFLFNTNIKKREYPFKDNCTRLVELKETITLPKNASAIYLPTEKATDGSGASFKGGYSLSKNTLTFTQLVSYKKRIYEPNDWELVRQAVISQNKFSDEKVIIKK